MPRLDPHLHTDKAGTASPVEGFNINMRYFGFTTTITSELNLNIAIAFKAVPRSLVGPAEIFGKGLRKNLAAAN